MFDKAEIEMETGVRVSSGGELERKSCGEEEREATTSWLSGIYEQAEKQWSESELGNNHILNKQRKSRKGSASKNSPYNQTPLRKGSDRTPKHDTPNKHYKFRKNSDQTEPKPQTPPPQPNPILAHS